MRPKRRFKVRLYSFQLAVLPLLWISGSSLPGQATEILKTYLASTVQLELTKDERQATKPNEKTNPDSRDSSRQGWLSPVEHFIMLNRDIDTTSSSFHQIRVRGTPFNQSTRQPITVNPGQTLILTT
jgi:hypothetical protein